MKLQPYNGHANYETWNVSLWLNNDEPAYRNTLEVARRQVKFGKRKQVQRVAREIRRIYGCGTPDFSTNLHRVRWTTIARDFVEAHD